MKSEYSSSLTVSYKGWHIHSAYRFGVEEIRVQSPSNEIFRVKTYSGAKRFITRSQGRIK